MGWWNGDGVPCRDVASVIVCIFLLLLLLVLLFLLVCWRIFLRYLFSGSRNG